MVNATQKGMRESLLAMVEEKGNIPPLPDITEASKNMVSPAAAPATASLRVVKSAVIPLLLFTRHFWAVTAVVTANNSVKIEIYLIAFIVCMFF